MPGRYADKRLRQVCRRMEEPMIGFRIQVNRDRIVTAGLEGDHVVSLTVTSFEGASSRSRGSSSGEQTLAVGGLQTAADGSRSHVSWFDSRLQVGDTISIEVVKVSEGDAPYPSAHADSVERYERQLLSDLLKKYGQP
jgi:hypothetical protein